MSTIQTLLLHGSELPEDLVEEILLRLPINSLKKFRRLSKQLHKFITSSSFAFRRHYVLKAQTFVKPTLHFGVSLKVNKDSFILYVPANAKKHYSVKANSLCNKLLYKCSPQHVLFAAEFGIYYGFEYVTGKVFVWNPTLQIHKVLPTSRYYSYVSCFDTHYFGKVDYIDGNFSYKVGRSSCRLVKYNSNCHAFQYQLELYSSETNTWKLIPGDFPRLVEDIRVNQWCVNLKGKAHWLVKRNGTNIHITTFDYETEVFGSMVVSLAPEGGSYDVSSSIVTLWDDKFLCLVLCLRKGDKLFVDIWVMLEYGVGDSWIRKFTVGPIASNTKVLGFSSKVQGLFLLQGSGYSTLLFCDCKSLDTKHCFQFEKVQVKYLQVVEHVESLVVV